MKHMDYVFDKSCKYMYVCIDTQGRVFNTLDSTKNNLKIASVVVLLKWEYQDIVTYL